MQLKTHRRIVKTISVLFLIFFWSVMVVTFFGGRGSEAGLFPKALFVLVSVVGIGVFLHKPVFRYFFVFTLLSLIAFFCYVSFDTPSRSGDYSSLITWVAVLAGIIIYFCSSAVGRVFAATKDESADDDL